MTNQLNTVSNKSQLALMTENQIALTRRNLAIKEIEDKENNFHLDVCKFVESQEITVPRSSMPTQSKNKRIDNQNMSKNTRMLFGDNEIRIIKANRL